MKPSTLLIASLASLTACSAPTSHVRSDTMLGRVVIYRNGVAYFERTATVTEDALRLRVPADKVDDFLRSLTVVDAVTGQPTPVSYPTKPALAGGTGLIDMTVGLSGPAPHNLRLSYVTESPSWKPSYRVILGPTGTVRVEGWAVVDNTSGEDWNQVKLGVGSSSAMSFRYDLHTVRVVERETLQSNDQFALAPPTGGSSYVPGVAPVLAELSDNALAEPAPPAPPAEEMARLEKAAPASSAAKRGAAGGTYHPVRSPSRDDQPLEDRMAEVARKLRASKDQVVVEGFAEAADGDKGAASLARANRVREALIRHGLPADRVVAMGRGQQAGHGGGVRLVQTPAPVATEGKPAAGKAADQDPIGTAHFESTTAMSVPRGSSAMVSILKQDAPGEVVYLYDAESSRGNDTFPFKAIRLVNPTDSVLEGGPVTVFGNDRFIGEGLVDPIPAQSPAFIPFALDRQVVVERKTDSRDEVARILTVQRGVFSTEARHINRQVLTLTNRQDSKAAVYIRHTVQPGYRLTRAPAQQERMGAAYLFRIELAPRGKAEVALEETTETLRTTDLRSPGGLELIVAHLTTAAAGPLRDAVAKLVALQKEGANLAQQIATTREQMAEYRDRQDELHAQIVTLAEAKTGASLQRDLQRKMQDMSQKVSQATLKLVDLQERQMIARIHFQDAVAELSLDGHAPVAMAKPSTPAGAPAKKSP
jgi:hypothetical protein